MCTGAFMGGIFVSGNGLSYRQLAKLPGHRVDRVSSATLGGAGRAAVKIP